MCVFLKLFQQKINTKQYRKRNKEQKEKGVENNKEQREGKEDKKTFTIYFITAINILEIIYPLQNYIT